MTPSQAGVPLRLAAAFAALLCGAAAVLLVADLLRDTPGPSPSATAGPAPAASAAPAPPVSTPSFPAPPAGAFVLSRQDGDNVLALAVRREGSQTAFQVSVVDQAGTGVSGLTIVLEPATGEPLATQPCGPGCYRATASGQPRRLTVLVGEGIARATTFDLPGAPPPSATALVGRAGRVWRSLHTLVSHERLASNAHNAITTLWRYVAPASFSYDIAGGASGVVIGTRRWDRASPRGRWIRGEQNPALPQPVPPWQAVLNAHVAGASADTWHVTFFDPSLSAWFALVLDRKTLRTRDLRMITTAHFMHDVYGLFDEAVRLHPPR